MTASNRVAVVVFGDLGRSPRMNYHTRSLLRLGKFVDLVGFAESPLLEELQQHGGLQVHNLSKFPAFFSGFSRVLLAPFKALWMFVTLLFVLLFRVHTPGLVLVQNPPSIPTLAVAWLVCRMKGAKLVVDWHNFGCTILAMSVRNTLVLAVARWIERVFGGFADAHICVSRAMKEELERNWGIANAVVLHDCPPEFFRPATAAERASVLAKFDCDDSTFVCVTATSFTKDEKLHLLLDAVKAFDRMESSNNKHSLFVVTGKGDGRADFEVEASKLRLNNCRIVVTYFDKFSDYALMLGSADLGLSFHASSSGFDLPMKIVDMFGAGTPVLSIRYKCIGELVEEGKNGLIFNDAEELSKQLSSLCSDGEKLKNLRKGVKMIKWDESWKKCSGIFM